MNELLVRHLLL